jgi:hypothetical protein
MSSADPFRVTLHGPGVQVDKQIDQAAALAILRVALGDMNVSASTVEPPKGAEAAEKQRPRLSLREYLDSVDARSNPEKITAFGSYLRGHAGQEDFTREDIKASFRSAGETLPANLPRDFGSAAQNGWIAEDPAKGGRFYVTRKGEEAVKRRADVSA